MKKVGTLIKVISARRRATDSVSYDSLIIIYRDENGEKKTKFIDRAEAPYYIIKDRSSYEATKPPMFIERSKVEKKVTYTDLFFREVAEAAKLLENTFRLVNIALVNEFTKLCFANEIMVHEVIDAAATKPYGFMPFTPGPGVGGHCIAVDPWFIVSSAPEQARMIQLARNINDGKPDWVINKVKSAFTDAVLADEHKSAASLRIACLGLAFKADIDDLRESPAMVITAQIAQDFPGHVVAVEPNISKLPANLEGKVQLVTLEEALDQADILVLLVDHREFKAVEKARVENKRVIDTRGLWNLSK